MMDVVEDLGDPWLSMVQASDVLGLSRATAYRQTQPLEPPSVVERAPSPRKLSDTEQAVALAVLHSDESVDQPPQEVYATLLSRGVYLASIRTLLRLDLGARERRRQICNRQLGHRERCYKSCNRQLGDRIRCC